MTVLYTICFENGLEQWDQVFETGTMRRHDTDDLGKNAAGLICHGHCNDVHYAMCTSDPTIDLQSRLVEICSALQDSYVDSIY